MSSGVVGLLPDEPLVTAPEYNIVGLRMVSPTEAAEGRVWECTSDYEGIMCNGRQREELFGLVFLFVISYVYK